MMTRLALAYFVAIVCFLLLVDFGFVPLAGELVNHYPILDKVAHFLMYGVLALLINAALLGQTRWPLVRALAAGSIIVLVGSTVEEFTNLLTTHRTWSLADLAANYLGIVCLGILPFVVWQQKAAAKFEEG